jgi:hypothetical protein
MSSDIDLKSYVKDFEDQKDCDVIFVCSDGEIGCHSKIVNDQLEYLKSFESFYSKSSKKDQIKRITVDKPIAIVKNFLLNLYGRDIEINKITDALSYIELATYLICLKMLNKIGTSFSYIIINYLKDRNYRGIDVYAQWNKAIKNKGLAEDYLENLLKPYINSDLVCRNWLLKESKTINSIKLVNSLVSSSYHLSILLKDTHGIRMLLQIINDDFKNTIWTNKLGSIIHFLPIEFWLNVCDDQEGTKEYMADLHQFKFNNSINLYYRKKIDVSLPSDYKICVHPLEKDLLEKDNILEPSDLNMIELDEYNNKMVFVLNDTTVHYEPLVLDLSTQTTKNFYVKDSDESDEVVDSDILKRKSDVSKKSVEYISNNQQKYLKIVLNDTEFIVKNEIDLMIDDYDNSILRFIRNISNKSNNPSSYWNSGNSVYWGNKDTKKITAIHKDTTICFCNSFYNAQPTVSNNNYDIIVLKDVVQFVLKVSILEIKTPPGLSFYADKSWYGSFMIKMNIPLKDFKPQFDYSKAINATIYIDSICKLDSPLSSYQFILNDLLFFQSGFMDKQKYSIYKPEYQDSIGIYMLDVGYQKGRVNDALSGISTIIMETGHIVSLLRSEHIALRIIHQGVESDIDINPVKNHNIVNVIHKVKTKYLLGHTGKLLTHIGSYVILLKTFKNSPIDCGVEVYCFNVFEMCSENYNHDNIRVYTIKTNGYYDTINHIDDVKKKEGHHN